MGRRDQWSVLELSEGNWTVHEHDDRHVVKLEGSFDLAAEQPLLDDMDRLFAGSVVPVLFDLSGVEFMDSTGVRTLLILRKRHGDRVLLGPLSEPVRRLFEIAGVLPLLSTPPSGGPPEQAGPP